MLRSLLGVVGLVDPRAGGQFRWLGRLADEPLGVRGAGVTEHAGALVADCFGGAVVDVGRGVQAEPGMAVLVVVPAEEGLAVQPGGLDRAELAGEIGPVLESLELGLGVAKRRIGARLGSSATAGEGTQNLLCAYMAIAVFIGLAANTLFGAWWLDGAVALGIAAWAVMEGRRAWAGRSCACTVDTGTCC